MVVILGVVHHAENRLYTILGGVTIPEERTIVAVPFPGALPLYSLIWGRLLWRPCKGQLIVVFVAMTTSFCGNSHAGCGLYPRVSQAVKSAVLNLRVGIAIYACKEPQTEIPVSS